MSTLVAKDRLVFSCSLRKVINALLMRMSGPNSWLSLYHLSIHIEVMICYASTVLPFQHQHIHSYQSTSLANGFWMKSMATNSNFLSSGVNKIHSGNFSAIANIWDSWLKCHMKIDFAKWSVRKMKDFVFFIFSSGVFHRHENFKSLEGLESDEVREKSLRNCMPKKLENEPYS